MGISREVFSQALASEGFPNFTGYTRPLYLLPVFQKRMAIGSRGYPFNLSEVRYDKGSCPVTERMHYEEALCFETCANYVDESTADLLVEAFRKVHRQRHELR